MRRTKGFLSLSVPPSSLSFSLTRREREKKREVGNAATKDNSYPARGQRELLRRRTMLSPPGAERRATKLCPVLHEDRLVLRESPLFTRSRAVEPLPPARVARCTLTWAGYPMPARGPACFRERIYISRNRLNFYTARRYEPENKTSAFLPIIGNEVAEAEASRREDKQSERETGKKERGKASVLSRESACVDLSRQQRGNGKKKKVASRSGVSEKFLGGSGGRDYRL